MLEADLVLWYDKPVTIRESPSCLNYPSELFYKFEQATVPLTTFSIFTWGAALELERFGSINPTPRDGSLYIQGHHSHLGGHSGQARMDIEA